MNSPLTASGSTPNTTVVFPTDRSGIGTLAVPAPYIFGYKLLPNGVLGVNKNMVYSDRDGLPACLLAYLNMTVGDWIEIFLATENRPVVEFRITEAHFESNGDAKNILFHISAADMEGNFAPLLVETKDMWAKVTRISDNSSQDSPHAQVCFKPTPPGEPDTDGGKPFNQGLKLPVASETIIDKTVITNGMFVTVLEYFNQHIGDIVVLAFGSLLLEKEVTVLGDIEFELTPEMLATLKPTIIIIVRWEVFDVVENPSGWSDALEIVFKPGIALLVAPIFEQADLDNVVHFGWLAGGPLWILITGIFAAGDVVVLLLEGITEGGDPVSRSYSIPVSAATRSLRQEVENDFARNLTGGNCRATYTRTQAGKTQESKPADVTISRETFKLGQPTVTPLESTDTVPVDSPKCRVQFAKYWPLKRGALVQVFWQTVDDAGIRVLFIFQQVVTDETSIIVFEILAEYIGKYPSSPLVVQCVIINPNEVRVVSEPLQLKIGGEKAIVLDRPTQVPKGTIDPLNGNWLMRAEYSEAKEGQLGRLRLENAPAGTPPFPRLPFNKNKRINWPLTDDFLIRHQGEEIKLFWNLWSNGERIASSPTTKVVIAAVQSEDPRFPTITVAGVTTSELDVKSLKPTDMLKVPAWFLQAIGQLVWLTLEGIEASGNKVVLEFVVSERVTSVDGYEKLIPLEWFQALKHLSEATVSFWVNFSGLPEEKSKVKFPTRKYLIKSTLPLSMNTAPMTLSGLSVKHPWPVTGNASIGNTDTRYPVGGTGPYIFVSDRPGIASVTSTGVVTGNANGTATITVTDQNGNSLSFIVYVSNVFRLAINENSMNYQQAVNWMYSLGASPVLGPAVYDVLRVYGRMPINKHYWLCDTTICRGSGAFFHHEHRAIYCADLRADYPGVWCLLRT